MKELKQATQPKTPAGEKAPKPPRPKTGRKRSEATPSAQARPVFLIGFIGSGKSTVGRLLAIRLGRTFIDLEQELSLRMGMATPMIARRHGDEGHRRLEAALLEEMLGQARDPHAVVATSEGIVERPDTVRWMRERGTVCFLRASLEQVLRRIAAEAPAKVLPLPQQELALLFEAREPIYQAAAHSVLDTDSHDPSQVVLDLALLIEEKEKTASRAKGSSAKSSGAKGAKKKP